MNDDTLRIERIRYIPETWDRLLEEFGDRSIFQCSAWLEFLRCSQGGEVVVATINSGEQVVGCFSGMVVRKFGLSILGSPFAGWTTSYMGLCLRPGIDRVAAIGALRTFAFKQLGAAHFEFMDRRLAAGDLRQDFDFRILNSFEVDLSVSEEILFDNMDSACRRCIRKAMKSGVVIEQAQDMSFADDYYAQMRDVFAKQGLVPTYNLERVRILLAKLLPTGNLLLLRARDSHGACIATGIFPGLNDRAFFWGGASWREHQILRPNEFLMWSAMKYWKQRGIEYFDMGGGGDYKRKYGGSEIAVPWFRTSKFPVLGALRRTAQAGFQLRQWAAGRLSTANSERQPEDAPATAKSTRTRG